MEDIQLKNKKVKGSFSNLAVVANVSKPVIVQQLRRLRKETKRHNNQTFEMYTDSVELLSNKQFKFNKFPKDLKLPEINNDNIKSKSIIVDKLGKFILILEIPVGE